MCFLVWVPSFLVETVSAFTILLWALIKNKVFSEFPFHRCCCCYCCCIRHSSVREAEWFVLTLAPDPQLWIDRYWHAWVLYLLLSGWVDAGRKLVGVSLSRGGRSSCYHRLETRRSIKNIRWSAVPCCYLATRGSIALIVAFEPVSRWRCPGSSPAVTLTFLSVHFSSYCIGLLSYFVY